MHMWYNYPHCVEGRSKWNSSSHAYWATIVICRLMEVGTALSAGIKDTAVEEVSGTISGMWVQVFLYI